MSKKDNHLATKAQAEAVRAYLASIGHEIQHTQALEVIARGAGARSRHLLAKAGQVEMHPVGAAPWGPNLQALADRYDVWRKEKGLGGNPPAPEGVFYTEVAYSYADGSNCKRAGQMVFRGRIHTDQLQLIASRLDEGLYFVPAQVGFESLHLAFTDEGGNDHWWHKLELYEPQDWELDEEGYVLDAGGVRRMQYDELLHHLAADADCDNLTWRFARLTRWDPELQEAAVRKHEWYPLLAFVDDEPSDEASHELVASWCAANSAFKEVPQGLLDVAARRFLGEHLTPVAGHEERLRRGIAPNAYLLAEVFASPEFKEFSVRVSVHANNGKTLCAPETATTRWAADWSPLLSVHGIIEAQRRAIRAMPAAWDPAFA